MVMYQALERLVSPVQVLAVLDGSEYEQNSDDHYYSNNSDIQSDYDAGDSFTSSSYLTTFLFEPILYHDYEEEQSVDPASIDHTVSHNGGPWEPEPAFPKKKVTWLNGSPRSFEELAVAFITVSVFACSYNVDKFLMIVSVRKPGRNRRVLLYCCYYRPASRIQQTQVGMRTRLDVQSSSKR